jgi:hypothetical protein
MDAMTNCEFAYAEISSNRMAELVCISIHNWKLTRQKKNKKNILYHNICHERLK